MSDQRDGVQPNSAPLGTRPYRDGPSIPSHAAPAHAAPAHATPSRRGRSRTMSYTFAIIALVAMVAGLAWVTQQMPNWHNSPSVPAPTENRGANVIRFGLSNEGISMALWDAKNPTMALPYEKG